MKIGILTLVIACIAAFITYKVFRDFQSRWKEAETFQSAFLNVPLSVRHLLIFPKQLGVEKWQPGDYATYQLKTNIEKKQISFSVAAPSSDSNEQYWLRTDGLLQFNEMNMAVWKLQNEHSLHPGSEIDAFCDIDGTFLLPFFSTMFPEYPIHLENKDDELVHTPIGKLKCQHYFVHIRSPNGKWTPLLELWSHPSVRPLGIVRARWRDEMLDLVDVKLHHSIELPDALSNASNSQKIREQSCTQCHHQGIGGKDLKIVSMNSITGTTLNLTQCLFHYHQTGLVNHDDLLQLLLISDERRLARGEGVRFTWTKGSFWIEANQRGELTFTLDALAYQGNLRAIPQAGFLVLKLRK